MAVGTIVGLAAVLLLVGLVSTKSRDQINGYPALDDRDANSFTLTVVFTNSPRGAGEVAVISTLNGVPNFTDYPTKSPRTWSMVVPRGSTITLSAWQSTQGRLSCTIKQNGKVVSDLSTERVGGTPTGVHCSYKNPV